MIPLGLNLLWYSFTRGLFAILPKVSSNFITTLTSDDQIVLNHFTDDLPLFKLSRDSIFFFFAILWSFLNATYMSTHCMDESNFLVLGISHLIYILLWIIIQNFVAEVFIIKFLNMPVANETFQFCKSCLKLTGWVSVGVTGAYTVPAQTHLPVFGLANKLQYSCYGYMFKHGAHHSNMALLSAAFPTLTEDPSSVTTNGFLDPHKL